MTLLRQLHLLLLLVDQEIAGGRVLLVATLLELLGERVNGAIEFDVLFHGAGDDQRRARFIDQDRVDLVDDRVVQRSLDLVLQREGHVVAQVVEAVLVVGPIGDIAGISLLLLLVRLAGGDDPDTEPKEFVERAHPVGVTAGQVVVDRDHMHAFPQQRIEVDRQRPDQRLALTGLHLGDPALVQRHAANHLDIEMTHAEHALARLPDGGERFRQHGFVLLAIGQATTKLGSLGLERRVIERFELGFQFVDRRHLLAHALDVAVVLGTDQLV